MISEYSYKFSELAIENSRVAYLMGYSDGILPEPFSEYLKEAMIQAEDLCNIKGESFSSENISFSDKKDQIIVDGIDFSVGKSIVKELRRSEFVFLFICTAGKAISESAAAFMQGNDPVLGYVYDVLGSVTVEAAMSRIHQEIQSMAAIQMKQITNRYSPGYCQWNLTDQHKLFSFFPKNNCGIKLTNSALMDPIKSVSGIIGMGSEVKFREYTCDLCQQKDCIYRNRKKDSIRICG